MEAFTDAVGLRALGLGARVIDVLDREIQLVLVPFGIATELAAAVGQHAQQLDIVLLEERQHTVIEQIGRRDRRLAVVELGKADLGVGVDEGLLVDASNTLQVADVEGCGYSPPDPRRASRLRRNGMRLVPAPREVTLSAKGAKRRTRGRKRHAPGTKARLGRTRRPSADLERQLEAYGRAIDHARDRLISVLAFSSS